jgi:hypothetical protein
MCPACLTTLALIVTGSTSVGSLTAFAVKKLRSDRYGENLNTIPIKKEGRRQKP